jgi:transcriptional regulator with XRE-family HTH domain
VRPLDAWVDLEGAVNDAQAMRQVLVDHARAKLTQKRGGGAARITLNEALAPGKSCDLDLLALDDALRRLSELDERKAKVVELRFFAGLSIEQTASVLGISHMTVSRIWAKHGIQPHRVQGYMASNDPDFEVKAAEVIRSRDVEMAATLESDDDNLLHAAPATSLRVKHLARRPVRDE